MLISDEYRALNSKLHTDDESWGCQALKSWEQVKSIADQGGYKKLLDYGCGKGMLRTVLGEIGYEVTEYDPAIPGKDALPSPHELVVCLDVLEHVEPECVEAVIADLARVTQHVLVVMVATRPSIRTLPDGSNPHRTVEPMSWWLDKFRKHFDIGSTHEKPGRVFTAILFPRAAPTGSGVLATL